jgi:hypothetical protein
MSSVLYSRGVNSQNNNPLKVEINRVIALNTVLEKRVSTLERELVNLTSKPASTGPTGPAGPAGVAGPTGPAGPAGASGPVGTSS